MEKSLMNILMWNKTEQNKELINIMIKEIFNLILWRKFNVIRKK